MIDDKIMRLADVMEATRMKRSLIYSYVQQGKFPKPFKLGGDRASGWLASEISQWITDRAAIRFE